jgi:hypothetical protein
MTGEEHLLGLIEARRNMDRIAYTRIAWKFCRWAFSKQQSVGLRGVPLDLSMLHNLTSKVSLGGSQYREVPIKMLHISPRPGSGSTAHLICEDPDNPRGDWCIVFYSLNGYETSRIRLVHTPKEKETMTGEEHLARLVEALNDNRSSYYKNRSWNHVQASSKDFCQWVNEHGSSGMLPIDLSVLRDQPCIIPLLFRPKNTARLVCIDSSCKGDWRLVFYDYFSGEETHQIRLVHTPKEKEATEPSGEMASGHAGSEPPSPIVGDEIG